MVEIAKLLFGRMTDRQLSVIAIIGLLLTVLLVVLMFWHAKSISEAETAFRAAPAILLGPAAF